jgi:PAS domain S-box-containing protein
MTLTEESRVATWVAVLLLCLGWSMVVLLLRAKLTTRGQRHRLELVSALAKDAIVLINDRGQIIEWNAGAKTIFGYDEADVKGQAIWSMMPSEHTDAYAAMFHAVIEGRITPPARPVELASVRRDGTSVLVELSVSTWKERGDTYVLCIFRDVSQRREMEEKLRASTQLFESVLNGASQSSIIGADERGMITVFNDGAQRLLGYDASEVCGQLNLVALHDRAEITTRAVALGVPAGLDAITAAACRGEAETREWTYVRKDGERVPVSVTVTATANEIGPRGFIAVAHDLTALRRLERRMEWANEAFRAAFDSAPVAVVLTTPDGRCVHANPAFCELSGRSPFDLHGMNMLELADPDDDEAARDPREVARSHLGPLMRGQRDVDHSERRMRRADGSRVWVGIHTSVVRGTDGKPLLFVTHVEDITQKQEVQHALRDALARKVEALDRLEEIDRAKSDFVSMVSHELRSPITSIIGYLELLRDGSYGELAADQVDALDIVDRNATRLLHLVSDLLTLSKLERSAESPPERVVVDVAATVTHVTESMRPITTKRRLRLAIDVDEDVPPVFGEERHIEQVATNLLTNAVKFTPDGGSIDVAVKRREGRVVFSVTDTGAGIPPEELNKVFMRFYRGQREEVANVQGTGLGLSIVRAIVMEHNGDVSIQSELGAGTTVTVELPALDDRVAVSASTKQTET